jgi:hypothetical protein
MVDIPSWDDILPLSWGLKPEIRKTHSGKHGVPFAK